MANSTKLWGGRFTGKADETFAAFNRSFDFDMRLLEADVRASIAYATGLRRAEVLTADEADAITSGLSTILELVAGDPDYLTSEAEDVHEFIETRLVELIGDAAKKLHTGRSRNDQVATAFRLWMRDEINEFTESIRKLQHELIAVAERHFSAVIPGYTHLQRAQPILWAHWCLAYFEMLSRDVSRLKDARKRINILPLGSGALAGTSFSVDREAIAEELDFDGVSANSLDAVSDRDFAIEFVAACSLVMVHLSRMAEDLILYCSTEFGFVTLSDAVSTGSSLMPQKKNPDALELIRGKAGRVFGHQTALLTTMKGLPLAYNKDMQEDKEAVFDTVSTVRSCLNVAAIVVKNISVNESKTREAATKGYLNATELADHLVKKGVPFRTAHEAAGKIVLHGIETGRELHEMPFEELQAFSGELDREVFDALSLQSALASKSQTGGTSPSRVNEALNDAKQSLESR
ncbi:MAG TPA: argininosuccinate lyase [Pyrinomonadaceae bacterium]|nr:argininosuccinate lyase [Pyrinomonadaceae bacterium]